MPEGIIVSSDKGCDCPSLTVFTDAVTMIAYSSLPHSLTPSLAHHWSDFLSLPDSCYFVALQRQRQHQHQHQHQRQRQCQRLCQRPGISFFFPESLIPLSAFVDPLLSLLRYCTDSRPYLCGDETVLA